MFSNRWGYHELDLDRDIRLVEGFDIISVINMDISFNLKIIVDILCYFFIDVGNVNNDIFFPII